MARRARFSGEALCVLAFAALVSAGPRAGATESEPVERTVAPARVQRAPSATPAPTPVASPDALALIEHSNLEFVELGAPGGRTMSGAALARKLRRRERWLGLGPATAHYGVRQPGGRLVPLGTWLASAAPRV